jgi:hypothetical protein
MILKRTITLAGLTLGVAVALAVADDKAKQPVLILLYTTVTDHVNTFKSNERVALLIDKMANYRKSHPQYSPTVELQFSGAVAVVMETQNGSNHLVDQVKQGAARGLLAVGYSGEDEPSYLRHPMPRLQNADTPELRWDARVESTEQFLTEYKDPFTGEPVRLSELKGGLAKVQEVFGPASFVSGIVPGLLGGLSPAYHLLTKYDPGAVALGIPSSSPRLVIEGFGPSSDKFATQMSPVRTTAPEVYWDDGILRVSIKSLLDSKAHSTDETPAMLKTEFAAMNRDRVRVIPVEYSAYARYLAKRADGSVKYDPMEWIYYHPDTPLQPSSTRGFAGMTEVLAGYKQEDETMKWLMEEFFPANPGSRFVSVEDLKKMAVSEVGTQLTQSEIETMAKNLQTDFDELFNRMPSFARTGNRFLSLAEAFEVLADSLATKDRTGSLPPSVKVTPIYGPVTIVQDLGPHAVDVTAGAIRHAAAGLAAKLRGTEWKPVPDNAVPSRVKVGDLWLTPPQFLRLMVSSYLSPNDDAKLEVLTTSAKSLAIVNYPTNQFDFDASNAWTFAPAPLDLQVVVSRR